jgi:hypothetical protein
MTTMVWDVDLLGFTYLLAVSAGSLGRCSERPRTDPVARYADSTSGCRWHRHDPLKAQHSVEGELNGHYAYYGITSNFDRISSFYHMASRIWRTALARRSQQRMPWRKMQKLLERFPLPAPRIVHRYGT